MHVFSEKPVREAKEKWPQASSALEQWFRLAKRSSPKDFSAMKSIFPAIDKVGEFHVFDIGGNKLRLIAFVRYGPQKLYIKHVLDHREYDRGKWRDG
jgi:mRNA interferase HigB